MIAAAALALPGQAFALTVSTLDQMPFETATQEAGHLTWQSNSKISTSGNARIAAANNYPNTLAYDFVSIGDTLTLQNVGTDTDDNAYDLKMTLTSASGNPLTKYFDAGWSGYFNRYISDDRIQIRFTSYEDTSTTTPQIGKGIAVGLISSCSGDCTLSFQYLKHGTSDSANAALFCQVYDLDWNNYPDVSFAQSDLKSHSRFNGCEGIKITNANLYLSKDTKLSSNSDGEVWISTANAGNTDGKDWSKAVCISGNSAKTNIMFGAYDAIDIFFDNQLLPDSPSKDAEITE